MWNTSLGARTIEATPRHFCFEAFAAVEQATFKDGVLSCPLCQRGFHTGAVGVTFVDTNVKIWTLVSNLAWDPMDVVEQNKNPIPDVSPHDVKILTSRCLRENAFSLRFNVLDVARGSLQRACSSFHIGDARSFS